jgi:hypothetical protein
MGMKPRIRLIRKVWVCSNWLRLGFFGYFSAHPVGHGYTPKEAYDDWQAQL